jgi:hypothetical protein
MYGIFAEDEHHFLFACSAYDHIRARHPSLFSDPSSTSTMASFLSTDQTNLMGRYFRKCHYHRRFILHTRPISVLTCFRAWAQLRCTALR